MLLVLDIGNTNTTLGIYHNEDHLTHWQLRTVVDKTADEYGIFLENLLDHNGFQTRNVKGIAVACVVPPLLRVLEEVAHNYFSLEPLIVQPGVKTGMPVLYEHPQQVGADRIANAVAAREVYGSPSVVIDLGTATTFDVISPQGEYLGGVITPGIAISADALFQSTAMLPEVEIREPEQVVGTSTVGSIQSGLFYGSISLIEGLLERIRSELASSPTTIVTGGLAPVFFPHCRGIDHLDRHLTLKGLKYIYDLNHG